MKASGVCRKCGEKCIVPSWVVCYDCDSHTLNPTKLEYKPTHWSFEEYYVNKRKLLEEAQKPLRPDEYVYVETFYEGKCRACGMELLNGQKTYCDEVCMKMYRLYPGMLGQFWKCA